MRKNRGEDKKNALFSFQSFQEENLNLCTGNKLKIDNKPLSCLLGPSELPSGLNHIRKKEEHCGQVSPDYSAKMHLSSPFSGI